MVGPNGWVIQVAAFKPATGGLTGTGGADVGGAGTGGAGVGGAGVGGAGVGGAGVNGWFRRGRLGRGWLRRGGSAMAGCSGGGRHVGGARRGRFVNGRLVGGAGVGGAGVGGSGVGGSGAGGSGNCASRFPLHVSDRLLVDACGIPFSVAGDSPQCLAATLSPANMGAYFAARAAQGFNTFWVDLLCTNVHRRARRRDDL